MYLQGNKCVVNEGLQMHQWGLMPKIYPDEMYEVSKVSGACCVLDSLVSNRKREI